MRRSARRCFSTANASSRKIQIAPSGRRSTRFCSRKNDDRALYENRSPTRWNGYMITWPVASSTEPTVLEVESVTRSVVYSACCEAHPGTMKSAPATSSIGKIRLMFDIVKISTGNGDLREQGACPGRSEFAIEDK